MTLDDEIEIEDMVEKRIIAMIDKRISVNERAMRNALRFGEGSPVYQQSLGAIDELKSLKEEIEDTE